MTLCVLFLLLLATCLRPTLALRTSYMDDGYQSTLDVMDKEDEMQFQQDFLGVLGFQPDFQKQSHRPANLDSPATRYMRSLHAHLQEEDEDSVNDEHLRHLKDAQPDDGPEDAVLQQLQEADMVASFDNMLNHSDNPKHDRLRFDFSHIDPGEVLTAAELRIHHDVTSDLPTQALQIQLFAEGPDGSLEKEAEAIHTVSPQHEGWISLNVTRISYIWWNDVTRNRGLRLVVTDDTGSPLGVRRAGFWGGEEWQRPFLITYLNTPRHVERSRQRRAASRGKSRRPKTSYYQSTVEQWRSVACQKRELYINFRELNMPVISPQGFYTNFCSGMCSFPLDSHLNASNHAIIQTMVKTLSNEKYPAPCCVPVTLGAISILYTQEQTQEVVIRKYKNMVVKTCGCR